MEDRWYAATYGETYYQNHNHYLSPEWTAGEVDGVLRLLDLPPGAHLLDLACGQGRHSLELARRGYDVAGLDLSPFLLSKAREAGSGVPVEWIQADMRDIPVPARPYDAVLSLFSSFGYLEGDAEEAKVLRAAHRVLAPGGRILIDTVNREVMLRRWYAQRWQEQPDGALLATNLRFDILTGVLHFREVTAHTDGRRTEERYQVRLWAYTELVRLLRDAGFTDVTVVGDFQGGRYTWDSHRMIVTARKE